MRSTRQALNNVHNLQDLARDCQRLLTYDFVSVKLGVLETSFTEPSGRSGTLVDSTDIGPGVRGRPVVPRVPRHSSSVVRAPGR
jgi:hypothetical protein